MSKQPEALRLAESLEAFVKRHPVAGSVRDDDAEAAAELRRLHAVNAELLEALNKFVLAANTSESALDFSIKCDQFIEQARAAIKRATEEA